MSKIITKLEKNRETIQEDCENTINKKIYTLRHYFSDIEEEEGAYLSIPTIFPWDYVFSIQLSKFNNKVWHHFIYFSYEVHYRCDDGRFLGSDWSKCYFSVISDFNVDNIYSIILSEFYNSKRFSFNK